MLGKKEGGGREKIGCMNTQWERGRVDNEFFPNFSRSIECGAGDGGRERVRERKIERENERQR